jgi:hypothetical protein
MLRAAAGACYESLELVYIQLTRLDAQHVAAAVSWHPIMVEELPEPVDVRVQRLGSTRGGALPPERVDQLIAGNDLVGV